MASRMNSPQEEQQRCADWMAINGYPSPITGTWRTDQQLAGNGAEDWVMEECIQELLHRETLERIESQKYRSFLDQKLQDSTACAIDPLFLPDCLFDFQSYVADWVIRKGKSAALLDCGMGKSLIELTFAENVLRHTNKPVLILTPLAVGSQFVAEGEKFNIEAKRRRTKTISKTINVANYEILHYFDPFDFGGVVCDEASCIKGFNTKRRNEVTEFLRTIPYRLMATATAAPNDYIELGTLSEALGVMGQVDMLNRFFRNDRNTCTPNQIERRAPTQGGPVSAGWRFKGHAQIPFWRWACGFTRAGRKPSDLGSFDDCRFVLPPLIEREHIVQTRALADGYLCFLWPRRIARRS